MSEKYAFFIDIDGTLLTEGIIPEKNKEAISYAREKGHLVFINTGRSLECIPGEVREMEFDGIVSGMGCCVIYRGEKVLSVDMPHEELAELFDYFDKRNMKFFIEGEDVLLSNYNIYSSKIIKSGEELLTTYKDNVLSKVFMPHYLSRKHRKMLEEKYEFIQHENYCEFCPRGYSKATGMKKVSDICGIPLSRCVALGDSVNDEEMMKAAGISAAMGDGDECIKKICSFVSCDARDGGMGEAIYKIIDKI